MSKKLNIIVIIPFLFLVSCTAIKGSDPSSFDERLMVKMQSLAEQRTHLGETLQEREQTNTLGKEVFKPVEPLKRPSGRESKSSESQKDLFSKAKDVNVAVDKMPLPEFIHYIFSDVFNVNYIVDNKIDRIKETVTLNLNQAVSQSQLFGLVVDILEQYKILIHEKEGIFYLWVGAKDRPMALGFGASLKDIPVSTGEIQQLIPIKYIDARSMSQFLPPISGMNMFPGVNENIIVARGNRDQIEQAIRIINILDRPSLRGRFISMRRLEYWNVRDMTEKLTDILKQEGIPVAKQPGGNGIFINEIGHRGIIIVFAAEKQWLKRVEYWVDNLDKPKELDEKQYFLYLPRNSRAEELGESLEKILGIENLRLPDTSEKAENTNSVANKNNSVSKEKLTKETLLKGKREEASDVSIAIDENRNALIVYATAKKYKALERLLKKLDVMPLQVLIETTIAEVTLKDSLSFGLEWYLKDSTGNQKSILSTLGGLGIGSGGLTYSLVADSGVFELLIHALATEDLVKILSNPRVAVRDGKTASFIVGSEVPIYTSETTAADVIVDGSSGVTRTVEYRSTGTSINVTPSVHAENIITLEITQEISEAQTNDTSDINSPLILNRTVTTEVVAADGQTILLAGQIRETKSETVNKVPILGDIPFLGNFFTTSSNSTDRTELVVMITPHIIRSTKEIDELREVIFESFENISIEK